VEPELFMHLLEQLLERSERGDPAASAFLAIPPIVFLVTVVLIVVLAAREMWVWTKKRLR
jgi:hypothetical protein